MSEPTTDAAAELVRLSAGLRDRDEPIPGDHSTHADPVTAALAALDRQAAALAERPNSAIVCEADADAARQLAGQIARLDARLFELGIKRDADDRTPPDEWPVTAALDALARKSRAEQHLAGEMQRLADWIMLNAPGEVRGDVEDAGAVGAAIRIMARAVAPAPARAELGPVLLRIVEAADRALNNWAESSGAVRGELRRRLAEAVDAGWDVLRPTGRPDGPRQPTPDTGDDDPALLPELIAYASSPDAEPAPGVLADMRRIATQYRGVAYDPHDRPEEILAVRRAAYTAGIIPFPSEHLAPPRSYRGATPPTPATPPADLARAATVALHPDAVAPIVERYLFATPGEQITMVDLGEHPSPALPGITDAVLRRAHAALADVYRDGYRNGYRDADNGNGNDPSDGSR
jgi:hypothetical protein